MDDFSQDVTQYPWNKEPLRPLVWFVPSILAGLVGGSVAPLVFYLLLFSSTLVWVVELLFGAQYSGFVRLVVFHLIAGISGAAGGAAGGLIYYSLRRKQLIRAARWSIVWAIIGLFGFIGFMMTVDWTMQLLPVMSGAYSRSLLAFVIVSTVGAMLTAKGLCLIDYDEAYG